MMAACVKHLEEKIIEAMGKDFMGEKVQIFHTLKELKDCVDTRCAAILPRADTLTFSGRPCRNLETRQDDLKIYDRTLVVDVVLGDETKLMLDPAFETFVASLGQTIRHNGHGITLSFEEAEWVEKKDSVLNAEIAVELPVIFKGGVYRPQSFRRISDIYIERQD